MGVHGGFAPGSEGILDFQRNRIKTARWTLKTTLRTPPYVPHAPVTSGDGWPTGQLHDCVHVACFMFIENRIPNSGHYAK